MKCAALTLDFAPGARRFRPARLAFLMVSLLTSAAAAWLLGQTLAGNSRQADELARLTQSHSAPIAPAARPPRVDPAELARVQFVRQTSQILMTPWGDLLAALESAPPNVAILSIEPSATRRSVALTAEAANPKAMLDYVRALQGDARLSGVVLVSHQVQLQAAGSPLRFQVQARWGGHP